MEDAVVEADGDGGGQARGLAPRPHVALQRGGDVGGVLGGERCGVEGVDLTLVVWVEVEHHVVLRLLVGGFGEQRLGVAFFASQEPPFHVLHHHRRAGPVHGSERCWVIARADATSS